MLGWKRGKENARRVASLLGRMMWRLCIFKTLVFFLFSYAILFSSSLNFSFHFF
jgi:hypothetical protein